MNILLDTNRYIDFCKNVPEAVTAVQRAAAVFLPFVTLAELRAGFACGTMGPRNEQVLTRFLASPRVRPLFADETTTRQYAHLFRQLRVQGTPIPVNDIWIAALAVQHDLFLCSRDSHFRHLPQIPVV